MDTKFKINKNILLIIICFCISVINFRLDNLQYLIKYHTFDFYKSSQLEGIIYEIGTNSVYTVVGDNASEKMLNYKKESREIIASYGNTDIFVINNNSKNTYSNNGILSLNEFNKEIKNYPYIIEINFKDNTMKKIESSKKINFRLKYFGNISQKRKEDVTTYIAIPSLEKIRLASEEDSIYNAYKQFVGHNLEFISTIGSKIIASIILLIILIKYIICLKKIKNKKDINIEKILSYKDSNHLNIYEKLKKNKMFNIEVLSIIELVVLILSYTFKYEVWYIPINTFLLINLSYLIKMIILALIDVEELKNNSILFCLLYKNSKSEYIFNVIRIVIIFTTSEIIVILGLYYYIDDGIHSYGGALTYFIDLFRHNNIFIGILLFIIGSNLLLSLFIIKKISKVSEIQKGINEFKNGNFNYKIKSNKNDIFEYLINEVNSLGEVINKAVEDGVKSERMKTELITNVSHDLKTPLTAIINYISLMKKEDIKPEHVKDYVTVLDKRTQKLKILIDDLFEASKISSNDIEINLEKTDINQLLMQSIVELEDEINKSNLDFITNTPKKEVYILGDGRKLWRVFENIISNITKYSLNGTRVYIDIIEKNNKVLITMKNISKYPLNFDSNEITERFTRGDLSRNTEGSGLGLAITKGFVEAQGGTLQIDILGDLFIATLEFDLYKNKHI